MLIPLVYLLALLAAPFVSSSTHRTELFNEAVESATPMMLDALKPAMAHYIWPTDASTRVTSSFAEYRTTHFHGGIDISTNGHTGYNVFAVQDGYILRIRITANGYGRMLFVKHPDGYISTYAHLKTFNDEINRITRAEQHRLERFAIDLTLDSSKIRVHKGDIIAYTGDSGFGPPHLHFELRDENLNPINPFLLANYTIEDRIPPAIKRVIITPLSYNSTIDNSSTAKILSRFPRRYGALLIPQKYIVHGSIGFGVEAKDLSNGTWSKAGIHSMELLLDDSLAFSLQLDRVPAEETKQIDLAYNFPMILQGWGKFQKLYIEKGNTLPFYGNKPEGTGVIETDKLREGKHDYSIVCKDFSGNQTTLNGTFMVNHSPTVKILRIDDEEIILAGNNLGLVEKCYVYGRKFTTPNWTQHTFPSNRFEADGTGIEIPFDIQRYDVVKIVTETKWGSHSAPMFYFKKKPIDGIRPVTIKSEIFNDYVRFTLNSTGMFTDPPKMSIEEGQVKRIVDLEPVDLYKYVGMFVPSPSFAGQRAINVQAEINGKPTTASDEIELFSIPTNTRGSFAANPYGLHFAFDSGAVYKPLHVQISSEKYKQSKVYILDPQDQLIDGGVTVSVPIEANNDHLGLYYRANGGWIFQTSTPDKERRAFSTTLNRTLGELCILNDDNPPSIGRLRVSVRKNIVFASFRYTDDLSGVDTDEIKMYIDDKFVIPEIDGEHRKVAFQSEEPMPRGKHTLKIVLKDRMKNDARFQRTFSVR
jgi:hypothetical protein